jgi:transposase InsO family protein
MIHQRGELADESAQYVSIHYTERLAQAGIEPSVGSVGDSYDRPIRGWRTRLLPTNAMGHADGSPQS